MRKTLFVLCLMAVPVNAKDIKMQTRRGEIEKVRNQWVLTDEKDGAKYVLKGFPPKTGDFEKKRDFYYLELKGRDVACTGDAPCFEVKGYEIVMYDPLSKDPAAKAAVDSAIKAKSPGAEMGGKKPALKK